MIKALITADQSLLRAQNHLAAGARAVDPEHPLDDDAAEEFEGAWRMILAARAELAKLLHRVAPRYNPAVLLDDLNERWSLAEGQVEG